jgi:signal transduction histidine kinase
VDYQTARHTGHLSQVLLNLLSNAVKFTSRGGIAEALEKNAKAGHLAELPMLLGELEAEFPRLQAVLQEVINGQRDA